MQSQNIRIRLKAFDHRILDNSTREIVNTAKRTGAQVQGAHSPADADRAFHREPLSACGQEEPRTVRNPDSQASPRHHRTHPADGRRADEARPGGGRRCRDQALRSNRGDAHRRHHAEGRHDTPLFGGRPACARHGPEARWLSGRGPAHRGNRTATRPSSSVLALQRRSGSPRRIADISRRPKSSPRRSSRSSASTPTICSTWAM